MAALPPAHTQRHPRGPPPLPPRPGSSQVVFPSPRGLCFASCGFLVSLCSFLCHTDGNGIETKRNAGTAERNGTETEATQATQGRNGNKTERTDETKNGNGNETISGKEGRKKGEMCRPP